jgi:hypothetical protein
LHLVLFVLFLLVDFDVILFSNGWWRSTQKLYVFLCWVSLRFITVSEKR